MIYSEKKLFVFGVKELQDVLGYIPPDPTEKGVKIFRMSPFRGTTLCARMRGSPWQLLDNARYRTDCKSSSGASARYRRRVLESEPIQDGGVL